MNRWRVDAEGQRARVCATFKTSVAAAVKMAKPGVDYITVKDTAGWTDCRVNIDWAARSVDLVGHYSWDQFNAFQKALAPTFQAEGEGVT